MIEAMNEQTSKERVLKVWPDAAILSSGHDGKRRVYAPSYNAPLGDPYLSGWHWKGTVAQREQAAWDDAASRLPSSPAGETSTNEVVTAFVCRKPECIDGDHIWDGPDVWQGNMCSATCSICGVLAYDFDNSMGGY